MKKTTDYHNFTSISTPKKDRENLNTGDIWINACVCLICGDYVRSKNLHDFKYCSCRNIGVDGGSFYARRIGNIFSDTYENIIIPFNDVKI